MESRFTVTTRAGDTVVVFHGHDGPVYRACRGHCCVNCPDLVTALTHLKLWREKL